MLQTYINFFSFATILHFMVMYNFPSFLICPQCGTPFKGKAQVDVSYISCFNCKARYPLVEGRIPFLFDHPEKVISQFNSYYKRYIKSEKQHVEKVESDGYGAPDRQPFYHLLAKGLRENLRVIEQVQETLQIFLPNPPLAIESIEKMAYTTDLSYLLRDWSGEEVHELEVLKMTKNIEDMLAPYYQTHEHLLVLGAGMGRITVELGKNFETVLALDNSPTMAFCYNRLLKSSLSFYDIQLKRAFSRSAMVKKKRATLQHRGDNLLATAEKIQYLLGNALNMPIADSSIEVIVSAYFTDVFPLDLLLEEVSRVLKPGGLFLHFGPLEYHFSDESAMYAADEFKAIFEKRGFEWVSESTLENTNFSRPDSMLQQGYINWQFLAKKKEVDPLVVLKNDTKISINRVITYKIEGQISSQNEPIVTIYPEGLPPLSTTPVVLEILKLMDAPITLDELLSAFCNLYEAQKDEIRSMILQTLDQLQEKEVVKIQGNSL